MKRKHKIVLGVALLVLCISIGLGIALWYLFGGNPNDSGDNGDDTTTVIPGDPDNEPETPHEHTYTSAVTKEPTCTQEGEMTYTCICGDSYTEPIAMTAHTEAIDEAVAPTCTATGLTEGKHCSVCGTVLVEQEVVPMIAHNYVNGVCDMCGAPEPQPTEGLVFKLSDNGTQYSVSRYIGTATEVYIPATYRGLPVTSIGNQAFQYCDSLTSITIPDSVTSIGDYAFRGCSSLTSITIPDSVTSIGSSVFRGCSSLTSIAIGNGVTSIGVSAFGGCSSLTSITIPDSVTSIGDRAFSGCSSLTSIKIPDSVTSIGVSAFGGCSSLTSIKIPDSVISIGYQAFFGCSSLTSIMIPEDVTSIGDSAFFGCSRLTSITIPDSVTSFGRGAFSGCSSLTSIIVTGSNPVYHSAGNCLIETDSKTLIAGCKNSIIPTDGSVTSIGEFAFYNCSSLTSVEIPVSVTSIGEHAFSYCSSIASIKIPDSVISIGSGAFSYCSSITSIKIPDSVTSIGGGAFSNTAYYNDESNWENGVLYISNHLITARSTLSGEYIIKQGTKTIADYAFWGRRSLTSITIPRSVTSIGNSAFSDCSSLTSVTFEDPEGWYVTQTEGATSGTDLANEDLADPATAAEYLRETYDNRYWYKRLKVKYWGEGKERKKSVIK